MCWYCSSSKALAALQSYHIDRCPSPSLGRSSPESEQPEGVFGQPHIPSQRPGSGSVPGWWTSSGLWYKSWPASPCAVSGSWDCNCLNVGKAHGSVTPRQRNHRSCILVVKCTTDLLCRQVWPRLLAPEWCASPPCWKGCVHAAL